MKRYTLYIICSLLALTVSVAKDIRQDSVRIALLTCSPGEKVYELFGHTAIRCTNPNQEYDVVFNYGVFDFNTSNFFIRFALGETDYQLGVIPFESFKKEYAERGSQVTEQVLNLTLAEAERLERQLWRNFQPVNRIYRYNYFYENCTVRARDRIEEALGGITIYPPGLEGATYRSWVRKYTKKHPWTDFGINLCLGSEADRPIDGRQQMFLPDNLMQAFGHGTVNGGAECPVRKLVSQEKVIIPLAKKNVGTENELFFTPLTVSLLLLAFVLLVSIVEWKYRNVFWGIDILFFSIQGLAGCLIAFLFFFSEHPSVNSNWLLLILNPLPLVFLPMMVSRIRACRKNPYDVVNSAVLILFIALLPWIPQKISPAIIPLALILLLRSVLHLLIVRDFGKNKEA